MRQPDLKEGPSQPRGSNAAEILESLADPVVAFDREWRYTYVSRHAARILGKTPEEMIGRTMWDLFPEDVDTGFQAACARAWAQSKPVVVERRSNVLDIWVENYIYPFEHGAVTQWRDITGRKRAEEALRKSEAAQRRQREFLEALIANVPYNIAVHTGRDLRFTLANPAYQALAAPGTQIIGRTYREVFPEAAAAGAEDRLRRVMETGESWTIRSFEAPVPGKPDATWEGQIVRLPLTPGEEPSILGISWDVTDRTRAPAALRESEARYRNVVETAFEGIWIVDCEGRTNYVNRRMAQMLKYDGPEELIGHEAFEFIPPEDRDAIRARFAARLAGDRREQYDIRLLCRDGSCIWASVSGSNICDEHGETVGRLALFTDITTRKQAEDALVENQQRLELALDAAELGTWDVEISTGRVTASGRIHAIFDLPAPEAAPDDWAGRLHPEDRDRVSREIGRAIVEASRCTVEGRVVRRDGSIRWVSAQAAAIRDSSGVPVRLVGVAQDITGRKQAEEDLRASEQKYRTLFDNMSEAIEVQELVFDNRGEPFDARVIDVNPAYIRMTGKSRQQLVGRRFTEIWDTSRLPEPCLGRFAHVVRTGEAVAFEAYLPALGIHTLVSAFPLGGSRFASLSTDITQRRRADEALRDSEEKLRSAFANAAIGFALNTPDGRYLDANPAYCAITGYSLDELRSSAFPKLVHADDRTENDRLYHAITAGELDDYVVENRYIRKDGTAVWVRKSVSCVRDPDGAVKWLIALVEDITARKQNEEALRESEERFRTLADNISQFAWMAGPDGSLFWYNRRWYEYTGTTFEQMQGWGWQAVHHPDHVGRVIERFRHSIETGEPWEDTFPLRGADGQYRWFLSRALPIRDAEGRTLRWFGTNTEITERLEAEERLRASEAREKARAAELAAILDAAPVALFVSTDPECREMVGSRMTYDILRLAPGHNLSKSAPQDEAPATFKAMKDGQELPPGDLPAQRAAATGHPVRNFEFDVVFEDGARRNLLGDAVPLFSEDGKPRGAVGAFVDITERKRTEERLRQTQKLESIGLLAGGIAHDFNNLLTGVMGNASLLLEELPPGQAEFVRAIMAGTERAAHLTRQLLAYSGKGQFVVQELDVSDAVNQTADLVQFSIPKSARLKLDLERRLPPVSMDPGQLQQILMNLVINAGEAIGEGNPGVITIASSMLDIKEPFVDAIGEEISAGRYTSIEVCDNGSGIDPEKRSKIFDPFFTTKFVGRGLGLAAVAGILRSQRGGIVVESTPGAGSIFRVLLPIARGRAEQEPLPAAAAGTTTVLVVDDERSVRDFIASVLRRKGLRILAASDGDEALAASKQHGGRIDAAVVDIVMPNMAAAELVAALRAGYPDIRILLTSGYSEYEARRLCDAYSACDFIQKPYTAQQLAKAIDDLLAGPGATR